MSDMRFNPLLARAHTSRLPTLLRRSSELPPPSTSPRGGHNATLVITNQQVPDSSGSSTPRNDEQGQVRQNNQNDY